MDEKEMKPVTENGREETDKNVYGQVLEQLQSQERVLIITTISADGQAEKHLYQPGAESEAAEELAQLAYHDGTPQVCQQSGITLFAEPFTRESRLILLGGGHVSLALEEFAAKTGFAVTVVDDRPTFANRVRFSLAKEVLCEEFGKAIEQLQVCASDYVVLLTRGHRHDGNCLRALVRQEQTAYLGMIGSRKRVKELKEQLEEEGISRAWLDSIHTPVGLDIGAVTPEEIAVSILAELILAKRRPAGANGVRILQSDIDMAVISELAEVPENLRDMKRAAVTIMATKGSTPRKAGAKMIVYESGMIQGTIGGGCAEAKLMQHARDIMRCGGSQICHVDMTGTVAEDEGMVCGGVMQVLIEAV